MHYLRNTFVFVRYQAIDNYSEQYDGLSSDIWLFVDKNTFSNIFFNKYQLLNKNSSEISSAKDLFIANPWDF